MKDLEFAEFRAPYKDADGDEHESVVEACVIDDGNYYEGIDGSGRKIPREFNVVGRSERVKAQPGTVLVKTDKPNEYDIHSEDTWKDMGYSTGRRTRKAASGKQSEGDGDGASDPSK